MLIVGICFSSNFAFAQQINGDSILKIQSAQQYTFFAAKEDKFYCLKCDDIGCDKIPCPKKDDK